MNLVPDGKPCNGADPNTPPGKPIRDGLFVYGESGNRMQPQFRIFFRGAVVDVPSATVMLVPDPHGCFEHTK